MPLQFILMANMPTALQLNNTNTSVWWFVYSLQHCTVNFSLLKLYSFQVYLTAVQ